MTINFERFSDGLIPAVIQDARDGSVLMLGYMNDASFEITRSSGRVTFFSRSRQRLWTKGETSGNFLTVESILIDCDSDTLLIKAVPAGPVCHTGSPTCFGSENEGSNFLFKLETVIRDRKANISSGSYTSELFASGINKIAQKVGEEAVELVIEAKDSNDEKFRDEAADLIYHMLVLFAEKDIRLADVIETLRLRS